MESSASNDAEPPGKRRTWWHPLLARLLEWVLRDSCEVCDEVNVGRLPLRLDIVLIRRLDKEIPDHARKTLAAISQRLNAYTLIEFKSPVDTLERGDWNKVLGCAHLFVAQSDEPIRSKDLSVMFLALVLTKGFQAELALGDLTTREEEPGIHLIEGGAYTAYVVETDRVVGLGEPVLTLFSPEFLNHPGAMSELLRIDHADMLCYVIQQIARFRRAEPGFEVQHMTENMYQTLEEMEEEILNRLPIERRLRGIATKDLLQRIPAEERLQGIPAEERLQNLSEEELSRIRKLLNDKS